MKYKSISLLTFVGVVLVLSSPALGGSYSLNLYDFENGLIEDTATNLEAWLKGNYRVTDTLMGSFGNFSYGYDVGNDETKLVWYNGSVPPGETARACASFNKEVRSSRDIRWTYESHDSVVAAPGLSFWTIPVNDSTYSLVLGYFGESPSGIVLDEIRVATVSSGFSLEQLNYDSLFGVTWIVQNLSVPISQGDSVMFQQLHMPGGGAIVFDALVSSAGSPFVTAHFTGQFLETGVPSLSTWGLIVLLVLLLASGATIVYRKRSTPSCSA